MKILIHRHVRQLASTLLVALVICTLLALSTASYLMLVTHQSRMSARSQTWNMAIGVVEAGIEEAMQHLNVNRTNMTADGWTCTTNWYWRSQLLSDGSRYVVAIDVDTEPRVPAIVSRAYLADMGFARNVVEAFFAQANGTVGPTPRVSRAVRVTCTRGNMFSAALVAKRSIDLRGNGIYTDSFDSSDPAKNTNGRYDKSKYSGDRGDVATNGGIVDTVSVQNANIYGKVHTGPNCPVSIGPGGAVGTHAWQASNTGFQDGYVLQDANFTFPDTTLPSISGLMEPPSGSLSVPVYGFSTNAVTSSLYPVTVTAGSVATNTGYCSSTTYPNPAPAWVTTNTTRITSGSLPPDGATGVVTNYSTLNVTSRVWPADATTYLGGIVTNVVSNGNPSGRGTWYSYNYIYSRSYTFNTYDYTYECSTYTYEGVVTNVTYATNYYDHIVFGNTTNYATALPGITYIDGPDACLVLPNGLTGTETFILGNGASLLLYVGGTSSTLSGNSVINPSGFAGNFMVYAAPSVTSFTLAGNGTFTGVLAAPYATVNLKGSGTDPQDFVGCILADSVVMNGHFSFHFDEALEKGPSNARYLITSWDEIR